MDYRTSPRRHVRTSTKPATRYITSLDGLRAFAVLAVIAYHLGIRQMQSGLLGVTIFFVLSGYLITGLLIKEWDESETIALKNFWLRRVRRLVPAIVTVLVAVCALCVLFNHELLTKMRPDIPPALLFFTNWWYIFHDVSYFEALGSPSPLTHFWSLAIEEQFYVIWPVLLLAVSKAGASKHTIQRLCLVLAVLSALAMALLFDPLGDPSRVYYGTDTRAFSLLIGAWLALSWPGQQFTEESTRSVDVSVIRMLDIAGTVSLIIITVIMVTVSGFSPFLYYGGIFLVSVLTAVVIAALVHPRSMLAKVAAWTPLVWIGKRSYGMYLWHYPLILLLAPTVDHVNGYPWWFVLIIYGLTTGIAALSYTFIENPIRKGAIGTFIGKVRAGEYSVPAYALQHIVPLGTAVVLLGVAGVGYAAVPDTSLVPKEAIVSTGASADRGIDLSQRQQTQPVSDKATSSAASSETAAEATSENTTADAQNTASGGTTVVDPAGATDPVLIGDSVPGAIETQFNAAYPHGLLDSFVGRWPYQAQQVYESYQAQGSIGHVVIFASFNNHLVHAEDLDGIIGAVPSDKAVFLVNISVPDDWRDEANRTIADAAKRYANVHVIDWQSACAGHESTYLYDDMIHLTSEGADAYQAVIQQAIASELPANALT